MMNHFAIRDIVIVHYCHRLDGGAVVFSMEIIEMYRIDHNETVRASKAIINVRTIAKGAKKSKLIEAIQTGEQIVNALDKWRKYCAANEQAMTLTCVTVDVKHDEKTIVFFQITREHLIQLFDYCSREKQRSYSDEVRQVDLLFDDIEDYLRGQIMMGA